MFHKLLDYAEAGENVGLLVRSLKKEEVSRTMVVAKPGTQSAHKKFKCDVFILTKEEGGRHTPFTANFKPQFFFRTADVTGALHLGKDAVVMPGDRTPIQVELIHPVALKKGLRFAIREGGKTVGAGVITDIIDDVEDDKKDKKKK